MPLQIALNVTAASLGFISALFFCVGSIFNTTESILLQATPFYDFSEPIALSLSAEKAQYSVGALLLVMSFFCQIVAATVSPTRSPRLLQTLGYWRLAISVVLLTSAVSIPLCYLYYQSIVAEVKAQYDKQT